MSEDLIKAVQNIIHKEFKKIEEYLPNEINIIDREKLSIEIQKLIEGFGYISRDKYEFLKKIIDDLEKRIEELESSIE